ncbi:MFS transporter [Pseudochryseolinea flava]|uniref:MFS transporter n=1 Tax=Pseudochryseolinea flava TaxID=2059302 RepID=A0A364Y761_9BACT|nr:MFS transporter [Pseudochryseolinea flava]RAW02817.1 MFS transporter [Pseudochryseolinea flava]
MTEIKNDPYAPLRIPDFSLFISARFLVTLAIQIQGTVVAWQLYEITKDPWAVGLIGAAEVIPSITVSLLGAGHIADVVERKKIILACLTTLLLCSALLLSFTVKPEATIGVYGAMPIYAVIFLSGIARGFLTPALFAFMPQLVSRELYRSAVTLNSTLWQIGSIIGPVIGGLIYGFYDVTAAYIADTVLVLAGVLLALNVTRKPLPPPSHKEESIFDKLSAGLRFVFNNKIVLSAISLDLFAVLFGGAVAMLPFFANEILHADKIGLGFLRAAPGVGAVMIAFYLLHFPLKKNAGKILFLAVGGFGLCMIGFALSTSFWLSLFILALSGAFDGISVLIRGTLLQTLTPENMKGRVSAVNNIFIGSSNELGQVESGAAAKLMGGVVRSVVFGGCVTLVVVAFTAWKSKTLRNLQKLD